MKIKVVVLSVIFLLAAGFWETGFWSNPVKGAGLNGSGCRLLPAAAAAGSGEAHAGGVKPRIALVIDDFGINGRPGVEEMFSIKRPLTFAIMPHQPGSRQLARRAAAAGHEVIVHLPMQPCQGKKSWLGPGAIMAAMPAREIKATAAADLDGVPCAVGFNNHMGSLITSREELLRPVVEEAAARGFFILDSRTTEGSRLYPLADKMGVPCIKRDVFLDDIKTVPYVKKQLNLLAAIAQKQGGAVGIGHVGHPATARAIAEMIPELEARGIELVYLSELVYQRFSGAKKPVLLKPDR